MTSRTAAAADAAVNYVLQHPPNDDHHEIRHIILLYIPLLSWNYRRCHEFLAFKWHEYSAGMGSMIAFSRPRFFCPRGREQPSTTPSLMVSG